MIARFFRNLLSALRTPWVAALCVILLLILLVWLLGPLVAVAGYIPLEGVVARLVTTAALLFCWGLFVALSGSRRRKRELADPGLAQAREQAEENKTRQREEVRNIRERLKAAVKTVTTSNFYGSKSRSRYALPWYLLLGTGNCGKTSVLLNSGLKFPLNEQADRHLYQLKATEHCDVLYSNEALFVDTPGAYTESRPDSLPHKAWTALLRGLFKVRPARPLNGIIVCVSMRDIIDNDAPRREHLARTIRQRLSEALKRLRAYVPVYLVFTKCDAVPGFAQFFAHLSRSEREQIFGCPSKSDSMEAGGMRAELKDLMQTLNAQIVAKIHQERDIPSRGEMFRFPQELAALGPRMEEFIAEAFGPSRYHRPVMFRGFFFSSALSARDIVAATARDGELSYQTGFNAAVGDYAKGFFLLRLLEGLIIPEARLADADKEHLWAVCLRRYGLQAAAAVLFLLAGTFLGVSFINNYSRVESLDAVYADFTRAQKKAPMLNEPRLPLPELNIIEQATAVYNPEEDSAIGYGLGLYQGDAFRRSTSDAYLGVLNTRLMPPVRAAAARRVEAALNNPAELKNALKTYLMLCQPRHINRKFLEERLESMWSGEYSGQAPVQADLRRHMAYVVTHGIIPATPDPDLLDRARKALLRIPLAELAYQRLREEAKESGKAPFTFRAALGQSPFNGDTMPIEHLYTREGYEEYLIRRCPVIIANLTGETWIFGSSPMLLSALDMNNVYKEVRTMYFRDYTRSWSQALKNLSVRMPATVADARKLAEELAPGVPPAVLALRELRANTRLIMENVEPGAVQTAAKEEAKRKTQQKLASKTGGKLAAALTEKASDSLEDLHSRALEEAQRDAQAVRQYFVPLDSLLDAQGNPGPALLAVQEATTGAGEYFAGIMSSDREEQRILNALLDLADEKNDVLRRLETAAARLPAPVRGWYSTVAAGGLTDMLRKGARHINQAYQERVITLYDKNLRPRYPFNSDSPRDANLDDFAAFFRSGGVLDSFHDAYLRPFITRTGALRPIMGRYMPLSSQAVINLQRANRVQEAFFMSGRELGITFLMEPHALDATLKQVNLTNAGKELSYLHGPVRGASFTWPADSGRAPQATLETVDLHGISSQTTARGEWALFRLLRGGSIKRQEGNTCLIEVHQQGKWAQFLIQFRNRVNPFDPAVCTFNLPQSLL